MEREMIEREAGGPEKENIRKDMKIEKGNGREELERMNAFRRKALSSNTAVKKPYWPPIQA